MTKQLCVARAASPVRTRAHTHGGGVGRCTVNHGRSLQILINCDDAVDDILLV